MDITTGFFLLMIGMLAGGYGTIVGAGGGFLFVPALLLIFKLSPTLAAGTGLVIVLINSLSGIIGYAKQKRIDYRTGLILGIGAFPGTIAGVWLLQVYSSTYFYIFFACVLVLLGLFLLIKNMNFLKKKKSVVSGSNEVAATVHLDDKIDRLQIRWLLPLGCIMGVFSSYLGIGGGWLLVPILVYVFRMRAHLATATSIFSLCLYTSVGVTLQVLGGNIDWLIVLYGGIGIIIGSQIGVRVSKRIPSNVIMQMLSLLLIIIGFRMFFH